jgi:hypothetical protein
LILVENYASKFPKGDTKAPKILFVKPVIGTSKNTEFLL